MLFDLLLIASLGLTVLSDNSKYESKTRKNRRNRKNDSWLDAAWFHDHNQRL